MFRVCQAVTHPLVAHENVALKDHLIECSSLLTDFLTNEHRGLSGFEMQKVWLFRLLHTACRAAAGHFGKLSPHEISKFLLACCRATATGFQTSSTEPIIQRVLQNGPWIVQCDVENLSNILWCLCRLDAPDSAARHNFFVSASQKLMMHS